ncbi:MAG: hypothetical protein Q7U60_06610 [Candidatus Methanoperedens sp.]|nr:hypothetical protein [Candidatus Methanoperedens sp.]
MERLNMYIKSTFGLLILIVFLSGCINSNVPTQKTQPIITPTPVQTAEIFYPTPTPVVNERSSMSFTAFKEAMQSNDLTTLQKENLYVNKIFRWDGQVTDVTQDTVKIEIRKWVNYKTDDVTNYYKNYCEYYNNNVKIRQSCSPTTIRLHISDEQKSQLTSLSKGSIITFEGTITDRNINWYGIDMYNGKIIDYLLIVIN